MVNRIEIENIEEMRRQQGIEDVELAEAIRCLKVGDVVRLTFLTKTNSLDTTPVRITRINGVAFHGKIIKTTSRVRQTKIIEFTISHIHSVVTSAAKCSASTSLH
jgi:hypothetical protein